MGNRIPEVGYYLTSSIVPQFYAWVEVGGEPLQVYGATESEKKTIGYIEAQEGEEFIVRFADQRTTCPEYHHSARLFIDGIWNRALLIRADGRFEAALTSGRRFEVFRGRRVTATSEQPFLFSKLATTDSEENACDDEQVIKNLGTIQLRCVRGTNYRRIQWEGSYDVANPKPIHENSKKAQVSHRATYGEAKAVPKKGTSPKCDWIDSSDSPFFQIEFRYRSRQLLQLEGHIPDSPVASPSPSSSIQQRSESPVVSTSNANRSQSATSQSPQIETDAARLARLRAQYESLQRQEQMARLQREIAALEGEVGQSGSGGSASSSARKVKAEPLDGERDLKKVKQENGEGSPSQSKGKGKEKKKAEVIVLSDSD